MPVEVSEGSTHVIKVDSDVPESGLDVLVSVQFGYGLVGGSGMVEVASEGPSQSMVLETSPMRSRTLCMTPRSMLCPLSVYAPPVGLST